MTIRALAVGNNNTTQADHRSLVTALVNPTDAANPRPGFFPANAVAALTNVSAMVVGIGAFRCVVSNSLGAGYFLVQSDSQTDITFDPGEAGVTRTDRVIVKVYNDSSDGSGLSEARVEYLKGQSSGGATALPSNALLIWEFPVPAGASSGNGGINFTGIFVDKRVYTTASGGVIPVDTNSQLTDGTTIPNPYDGLAAYVRATDILYVYDGTLWRPKGQINVASSSNLNNVLNPEDGTIAVARDTQYSHVYDGSAWQVHSRGELPYLILNRSAAQTLSDNTVTNIAFDTVEKNVGFSYTSGANITLPKTGSYQVIASIGYATNGTGVRQARITLAGTNMVYTIFPAVPSFNTQVPASGAFNATAGQVLTLAGYQNSGAGLATVTGEKPRILVKYLGP